MVSGCHGDCEYGGGDGAERVGTPVDGAHLVCQDHYAHVLPAAAFFSSSVEFCSEDCLLLVFPHGKKIQNEFSKKRRSHAMKMHSQMLEKAGSVLILSQKCSYFEVSVRR